MSPKYVLYGLVRKNLTLCVHTGYTPNNPGRLYYYYYIIGLQSWRISLVCTDREREKNEVCTYAEG